MTTTTEAPFAGDVDEPDHASVPLSRAQVGDHGVYLERRLSRKGVANRSPRWSGCQAARIGRIRDSARLEITGRSPMHHASPKGSGAAGRM
jgi:hypothetical protein